MAKKRKPTHPGEILTEDYIKPLRLNLEKLAERLGIARNTLFKIRTGQARITPAIAISLAEAFDTTPQLWLNLQANYDLWIEDQEHTRVRPIVKNGELLPGERSLTIAASPPDRR
jgi:addiction module HigA family antidote